MSRYPNPRPPRSISPEGLEDLLEWEQSRAEHYKAQVKELEAEIKLWHDTLDGTVYSTCHVMRLMEKVIRVDDD